MRLLFSLASIWLAVVPSSPLRAQQLSQHSSLPPVARPVTPSPATGVGPSLIRTPMAPVISSDLGQRPANAAPIRATGPAVEPLLQLPTSPTEPLKLASSRLLDPAGRPIPGVVRVAPNRVYDPGSGRYYWTVGSGPAEHVVP